MKNEKGIYGILFLLVISSAICISLHYCRQKARHTYLCITSPKVTKDGEKYLKDLKNLKTFCPHYYKNK